MHIQVYTDDCDGIFMERDANAAQLAELEAVGLVEWCGCNEDCVVYMGTDLVSIDDILDRVS